MVQKGSESTLAVDKYGDFFTSNLFMVASPTLELHLSPVLVRSGPRHIIESFAALLSSTNIGSSVRIFKAKDVNYEPPPEIAFCGRGGI